MSNEDELFTTATHESEGAPDDDAGAINGTDRNSAVDTSDDGGEPAREPDILLRLADDLKQAGLAGEERIAQIIVLAATSRLFTSPLSVAVKGPSSGGKSQIARQALRFLPPEAFYTLTSVSERALIYTEEDLRHRMLVLYEADAITKGGTGAYILRSLLSEGEIRHERVNGSATQKIMKSGPTGLIVTTCETGLDPELETRLLSLTITDTPEQTKAVFHALARAHSAPIGAQIDYDPWHRLQRWLALGPCDVVIPYAEQLADRVPPVAIRLRRDFGALLTLIRAHTLLHRASRTCNEAGAIIASVDDYAAVRALVADLFAEGVGATVPVIVRETVNAAAATRKGEVSLTQLAARLGLDKSVASRRLRQATDLGYLVNRETRSGQPARIALGEPMPEEVQVLPEPHQLGVERPLQRCRAVRVNHPHRGS